MHDIFYTCEEGGMILHKKINLSQEEQKTQCETQSLNKVDPYHRVSISDGNITIMASAVFFLDGLIWDAILSGYDTFSFITRSPFKKWRLPKCFRLPYWRNL